MHMRSAMCLIRDYSLMSDNGHLQTMILHGAGACRTPGTSGTGFVNTRLAGVSGV